jgi:polysaccharide biosynthesis/export protein
VSTSYLPLALALSLAAGCATTAPGRAVPAGATWPPQSTGAELAGDPAGIPLAWDDVAAVPPAGNQYLGPHDLLDIKVLEASELNRSVRVSGDGAVSMPLVGEVRAAGLTPRELELELEARLRTRFILDPHVSVQVAELESRSVSVVGAVNRPGLFQSRGVRSLLDVLALAGGLSETAGGKVIVVRAPSAPSVAGTGSASDVVEVDLQALLESGDARHNVPVYPGDAVKVVPAALIYVVGEVNRPGAFPLARGAGLTVVQAISLGSGLRPMASRHTVIIRTTPTGERTEIDVDLGAVLSGRAADPPLQARDILFVPNNTTRAVALGVVDALVRMVTLRGIF